MMPPLANHWTFQFPPLREGRPGLRLPGNRLPGFQFPPLREGRQFAKYFMVSSSYFNSRPCERGDLAFVAYVAMDISISIPAPARGATKEVYTFDPDLAEFQFPPLREGRRRQRGQKGNNKIFQFPPLREGRLPLPGNLPGLGDFNSRPCERGDTCGRTTGAARPISIPAPARGATHAASLNYVPLKISIPAPARGATAYPGLPHRP